MAIISLEEAVTLINARGWLVRDSRRNRVPKGLVTQATVIREVLLLQNGPIFVDNPSLKGLTFDLTADPQPRQIAFRAPIIVREMRKNSEGGGWREWEQMGRQLLLVNIEAQAAYDAAQVEKRRQIEEAARLADEQARSGAAQLAHERICAYFVHLKELLEGAHPTDLAPAGNGFSITFDNGIELKVGLEGGDLWDARIVVEGDGKAIDLDHGLPADAPF